MADKLSWTELRKMVKINGFGTFKLQAVAPRKSVNVKTGEEIVIPGYNKIVFMPEVGVKELVERGAEVGSETTDVVRSEIDPLKKLGEQAEEIVDLLADLGQDPKQSEKRKEKSEKVKPEPVVEAEPVVAPEPIVEPEPVVAEPQPVKEPEKPKKQFHFVRDLLICVVVLLLLLFGGYFFLRSQLTRWMESLAQPKVETPVVVEPVVEPEPVVMDTIVPEPIVEEPVVEEPAVEPEQYSDLITIEEMHEASRLTWMAKRYYGDKKYWPYLYDANRDVIVNPSRIKVGTPIRVPKLTKEQRDTTNAETKARLEALRIEAEEACRTK